MWESRRRVFKLHTNICDELKEDMKEFIEDDTVQIKSEYLSAIISAVFSGKY